MKKQQTTARKEKFKLSPGAKRFRKLLKDRKLSYRDVANRTDVSINIIYRLGQGRIMTVRKEAKIRIFMFLQAHWGTIFKEEFSYWKREAERELEIAKNSKTK